MEGDEAIQSKSQKAHGKKIKVSYSDRLHRAFIVPLREANKPGLSLDHVWE